MIGQASSSDNGSIVPKQVKVGLLKTNAGDNEEIAIM
jgi:hypothetical protein